MSKRAFRKRRHRLDYNEYVAYRKQRDSDSTVPNHVVSQQPAKPHHVHGPNCHHDDK